MAEECSAVDVEKVMEVEAFLRWSHVRSAA